MSWKIGLISSLGLFGFADTVPLDVSPFIQFGALGILGVSTIKLFAALKDQQSINSALADRIAASDTLRHNDSQEIQNTLREITAGCAVRQSKE